MVSHCSTIAGPKWADTVPPGSVGAGLGPGDAAHPMDIVREPLPLGERKPQRQWFTPLPYPSKLLPYDVDSCSSFSSSYPPRNILVHRPTDQSSRWSSGTPATPQYITLRLDRPSIVSAISFGKYHKPHVCNLREFIVYGGLTPDCEYQLLHDGLNNDGNTETFPLIYDKPVPALESTSVNFQVKTLGASGSQDSERVPRSAFDDYEPLLLPVKYIKIEPLQSFGPNYNFSIWHVKLHGIDQPEVIAPALGALQRYREHIAMRLCLKFLRERIPSVIVNSFGRARRDPTLAGPRAHGAEAEPSGRPDLMNCLEHPLIGQLYEALVEQADYQRAEQILQTAAAQGIFANNHSDIPLAPGSGADRGSAGPAGAPGARGSVRARDGTTGPMVDPPGGRGPIGPGPPASGAPGMMPGPAVAPARGSTYGTTASRGSTLAGVRSGSVSLSNSTTSSLLSGQGVAGSGAGGPAGPGIQSPTTSATGAGALVTGSLAAGILEEASGAAGPAGPSGAPGGPAATSAPGMPFGPGQSFQLGTSEPGTYAAHWRRLHAAGGAWRPCGRGGHQMVLDPVTDSIFLHGGWSGTRDLSDFWQYHIARDAWVCLSPDTGRDGGPTARSCHTMAIDSARGRIFFLGGYIDCDSLEMSQSSLFPLSGQASVTDLAAGLGDRVRVPGRAFAHGPGAAGPEHPEHLDADSSSGSLLSARSSSSSGLFGVPGSGVTGMPGNSAATGSPVATAPPGHSPQSGFSLAAGAEAPGQGGLGGSGIRPTGQSAPGAVSSSSSSMSSIRAIYGSSRSNISLSGMSAGSQTSASSGSTTGGGSLSASVGAPGPEPMQAAHATGRAPGPMIDEEMADIGIDLDPGNPFRNQLFMYEIATRRWSILSMDTALEGGPQLIHDHQMFYNPNTEEIIVFGGRVFCPPEDFVLPVRGPVAGAEPTADGAPGAGGAASGATNWTPRMGFNMTTMPAQGGSIVAGSPGASTAAAASGSNPASSSPESSASSSSAASGRSGSSGPSSGASSPAGGAPGPSGMGNAPRGRAPTGMHSAATGGGPGNPADPPSDFSGLYAFCLRQNPWRNIRPDTPFQPPEQVRLTSRFGHSVAFDPESNVLLVLGGQRGRKMFNDITIYDLATDTVLWNESDCISVHGPPAGFTQRVAFDAEAGVLLVTHGLVREVCDRATVTVSSSVWAFDIRSRTWSRVVQSPAGGLAALDDGLGSPDAGTHPGATATAAAAAAAATAATAAATTTTANPHAWAGSEIPSARFAHALVFDQNRGKYFLFGGNPGEMSHGASVSASPSMSPLSGLGSPISGTGAGLAADMRRSAAGATSGSTRGAPGPGQAAMNATSPGSSALAGRMVDYSSASSKRMDDLWELRLDCPWRLRQESVETSLRQARFMLRRERFVEMCSWSALKRESHVHMCFPDDNPLEALAFLQNDIRNTVAAHSLLEDNAFRSLPSLLFSSLSDILSSSTAAPLLDRDAAAGALETASSLSMAAGAKSLSGLVASGPAGGGPAAGSPAPTSAGMAGPSAVGGPTSSGWPMPAPGAEGFGAGTTGGAPGAAFPEAGLHAAARNLYSAPSARSFDVFDRLGNSGTAGPFGQPAPGPEAGPFRAGRPAASQPPAAPAGTPATGSTSAGQAAMDTVFPSRDFSLTYPQFNSSLPHDFGTIAVTAAAAAAEAIREYRRIMAEQSLATGPGAAKAAGHRPSPPMVALPADASTDICSSGGSTGSTGGPNDPAGGSAMSGVASSQSLTASDEGPSSCPESSGSFEGNAHFGAFSGGQRAGAGAGAGARASKGDTTSPPSSGSMGPAADPQASPLSPTWSSAPSFVEMVAERPLASSPSSGVRLPLPPTGQFQASALAGKAGTTSSPLRALPPSLSAALYLRRRQMFSSLCIALFPPSARQPDIDLVDLVQLEPKRTA
ncbi:hypothetical protein H696_01176 [Fonticula alba]|uniref:Muskelin N-terminal domain-containing protein n=1 Tax=Fonticula alba TaxID=691883 RepID=A0A058ZBF5_FONAL|nr:hypothetical protein H696_01176 [Fonticula alba]KCV71755.1 hypothetical protein H696_01176 [Fonticula alba]|eukprot:XP_009493333.1 hypothetical protein H696_01176 [Fonticula alba]